MSTAGPIARYGKALTLRARRQVMARTVAMTRSAVAVLVLAAAALATSPAPAQVRGTATQSDTKAAADFELGYSDGRSNLKYRDADRSNQAYADGYKAGQARRSAGVVVPPAHRSAKDRADFELGYRDGVGNLNYRDSDRSNKAYADGFKAGQARRQGTAVATPTVPTDPKARADYNLGYGDGQANRAYRDGDRSNKAYADGYNAGQARRQGSATVPPAYADAKSRIDYNLGYADGYGNRAYRDGDRSNKAYADGYQAGQARRGGGGTVGVAAAPVHAASDLIGRSSQEVEPGMKSLGYKRMSGSEQGQQAVSTWRGASRDDCLQVVVSGGIVTRVDGVNSCL
jgi:hypothetical protein